MEKLNIPVYTVKFIVEKFANTQALNQQYSSSIPYPYLILDNFLPENTALALEKECDSLTNVSWKKFDRNHSKMDEYSDLSQAPQAFDLVAAMHSQQFMQWLSEVTGIDGVLPDPYLTGAGYSKIYSGEILKPHTDFNWNDRLKLHRAMNVIIYLNSNWKTEYYGALELRDFENKTVIKEVEPIFNRCIIWPYHKLGFHGMSKPVACPSTMTRNTFRLFYYYSNSTYNPDDLPHRSQYWFDAAENKPYDVR